MLLLLAVNLLNCKSVLGMQVLMLLRTNTVNVNGVCATINCNGLFLISTVKFVKTELHSLSVSPFDIFNVLQ